MRVDGVPNTFAARDRAVLAALAMFPGVTVTTDRLADAIWGERRPVSWNKVIPGCVMRLRRALGARAIETTRNGYRLAVEADAVDVQRFERLVTRGHELLEGAEPGRAADLIGEALAIWRGAAFIDLEDWEPRVAEARRLEEIRLEAQEEFVEACQRSGRHHEVLALAQSMVRAMPFRERRWALLAGAQYRAGRQTDALRTLHEARTMLAAELGVDPGPGLVELEHAILRHDPLLAARSDRPLLGDVGAGPVVRPTTDRRGARPHSRANLPTPATTLIDRDDRLAVAMRLVEDHRLVTLTGTGGVGKSRLAVEVGRRCLDQFDWGVWLVELAPVASADSVVAALASTLSVPPQQGLTLVESIVDWFRGRDMLLIVDNCEHVRDPVRHLTAVLLAECPTVKIVATSREPLGLGGEHVYRVNLLNPQVEGVTLFLERAVAADSSFVVSDAEEGTVATICGRLDGLPLAIELAAARVRSMAPVDLLARLDDRFRLLRGVGGNDHHATLWATVEWSYQLLAERERAIFARLSVFAGSFDLAAVEAICATGTIDGSEVVDSLSILVDKSMVLVERSSEGTRYQMLETLRLFGEARLRADATTATVREQHLRHYVEVAVRADNILHSSRQVTGAAIFDNEWANLRKAHEWAILTSNLSLAERLILACRVYSVTRLRREHGDWVEKTIALGTEDHPPSPDTFAQGAFWAFSVEDYSRTRELLARGIDLAASMDDPSVALCLTYIGRNEYERTPDPFQNLEAIAPKLDLDREWWVLTYLANSATQFESSSEQAHVSRLVEAAERIRAPLLTVAAMSLLGRLSIMRKPPDYTGALDLYRRALAPARQCGDLIECECLRSIALASVGLHPDSAIEACRQGLVNAFEIRCWFQVWNVLESIGLAFALTDQAEAASVVIGNLEAHHPLFGPVGIEHELGFRSRVLDIIRPHPRVEQWMARGAAMDRYQIVEFAVDELGLGTRSVQQVGDGSG